MINEETIDTVRLACLALEKSPNWQLSEEDPRVYLREDREGYNPIRQWPGEPLPSITGDAASEVQVAPKFDEATTKLAMSTHHINVDFLKKCGFDPCKEYAAMQVTALLEAILPNTTLCPICKKDLSNTQRLRAHIRGQHMSTTPFYCGICEKYFSDLATKNLHMRKHDANAPLFACSSCTKTYTVKSRLTEHLKSHLAQNINQPCQFCGKRIKEIKNLKSHEKYCVQNPNKPAKLQCPYCPKEYDQKKDLRKHAKKHHPGRNFEADFVPPPQG